MQHISDTAAVALDADLTLRQLDRIAIKPVGFCDPPAILPISAGRAASVGTHTAARLFMNRRDAGENSAGPVSPLSVK